MTARAIWWAWGVLVYQKESVKTRDLFFLEKCILTSNIINGLLWSKPKGVATRFCFPICHREERLSSVIPPV